MLVFKFGGASVKDAEAVKNVVSILRLYSGTKLGIVISAMGKTTNAMENIVTALLKKDKSGFQKHIEERRTFHLSIMNDLFSNQTNSIYAEINAVFDNLSLKIDAVISENPALEYDQVVSLGEILSTKIVAAYCIQEGISTAWLDARTLIRTNSNHREAEVDWKITSSLFQEKFIPKHSDVDVILTQGFIGHTSDGLTTTIGREGSDFSAGIIAYCCNAESVTIWKDVPGMLNADPKWFDNTVKLDSISFHEAIELAYYGASVIHPKTIKPLQNKQIPLYVKSFINPKEDGTVIQSSTSNDHLIPSFIFKLNQILFSFTPKDFSFIVEKNLSDIFGRLAQSNAKINIMQNSALNFSILVDEDKISIKRILELFEDSYTVKYNRNLELVTIRHYDQVTIDRVTVDKEIILQQKTRETARLVVKQQ